MPFLRKYNTLLVTGTTAIRIPIIKRGVVDYAVGADWTPAAGDVKINIDGAGAANVTNLPTAVAMGNTAYWEFVLTAAELSCKQCIVTISDAATKAVEDQCFNVETFGNASAMYAADLSLANLPANVTQLLGTAWLAPAVAGTPDINVKTETDHDLTATQKTSVQTACDAALVAENLDHLLKVAAVAGDAVDSSIIARMASKSATPSFASFVNTTDSLEAIRDKETDIETDTGEIGVAGVGLTNLGDARIANLDATISSRLAPAGTLAIVTAVTNDVGITQAGADKVWGSAARTLTSFGTLIADIFGYTVEGAMTFLQSIRISLSALARKSAGGGTATITFKDGADTKARITATVDANGNRTAVTVDGT